MKVGLLLLLQQEELLRLLAEGQLVDAVGGLLLLGD